MTILDGFLFLLSLLVVGLLAFQLLTWLAGMAERLVDWIRGRQL